MRNRLVADLEVFAQRVEREGAPDEVGQPQDQKFDFTQILDPLETGKVLANKPGAVFARPALGLDLGAPEERFRESSQLEELLPIAKALDLEFGRGERVQASVCTSRIRRGVLHSSGSMRLTGSCDGNRRPLTGRGFYSALDRQSWNFFFHSPSER